MNQSTYTRSGVWGIISKLKQYVKNKYIKSLRFRIVLLLILVGVVSAIVTKIQVISGYEERAVEVKTAEIKSSSSVIAGRGD